MRGPRLESVARHTQEGGYSAGGEAVNHGRNAFKREGLRWQRPPDRSYFLGSIQCAFTLVDGPGDILHLRFRAKPGAFGFTTLTTRLNRFNDGTSYLPLPPVCSATVNIGGSY